MNPFQLIAENRIREAMENGEFDNLPGQGKPIDFSEEEHIPPEYRMAYRILKNSGHNDSKAEILAHRRDPGDKSETLEKLVKYKEAELLARKNRRRK